MNSLRSLPGFCLLVVVSASAIPRYVDLNSTGPVAPFTSWATAATRIQDAIDVADAGDEVMVANGVYNTGGRAVGTNIIANRVAVDKAVTVRSVNGPAVTTIQGYQLPVVVNGEGAIRCVYLTNGASLYGFTLTGGGTRTNGDNRLEQGGGGVCSASSSTVISNCFIVKNSAAQSGGGAYSGKLVDSVIAGNDAGVFGGGCVSGTILNCTLSNNVVRSEGGGAASCNVTNCLFVANVASNFYGTAKGGGAAGCPVLSGCTVVGNYAQFNGGGVDAMFGGERVLNCLIASNSTGNAGGGIWNVGVISGCILQGNRARFGGGVHYSGASALITNCLFVGNVGTNSGGGVMPQVGGTIVNCTFVGNSSAAGAGVYLSSPSSSSNLTLNSCIIVSNITSGGSLDYRGILNFCCTMPQPTNGVGNITNLPVFVDYANGNFRLAADSPCINAGNNPYLGASVDLDANQRISGGTVDIGAYEFQSPASALSYAWAQRYGLSTDGLADFSDTDGDGHNNWQEWRADSVPTNAASCLQLLTPVSSPYGWELTWPSSASRRYFLERATNNAGSLHFHTLATNIAGEVVTTTYTDTSVLGAGPYFYRVGVGD